MQATRTRWGILGTGAMSSVFVRALKRLPDAEVVAVGARDAASARSFADREGIARASGYAEVVADPSVDLVYVGTVNTTHRDLCLMSLDAGKPVVCEKPFTLNAAEAREVVARARARGLFCMEAMWTRFLPAVVRLKRMVESGEVGDVRMFSASLGHPFVEGPENRQFNRDLGGGALLDLGVYPISLAFHLLGRPDSVVGRASLAGSGVDAVEAVIMTHPGGKISSIAAGIAAPMPNDAFVMGSRGLIRLHGPLYRPTRLTVERAEPLRPGVGGARGGRLANVRDLAAVRALAAVVKPILATARGRRGSFRLPPDGNGYEHQAIEAMRCLREGLAESPTMPLDESVAVMEAMDELRRQWGLSYPGEPPIAGAGLAGMPGH